MCKTLLLFATLLLTIFRLDSVSGDRQAGARRIGGGASGSGAFKSPCGDALLASQKIGACVQPIMELIEAKVPDPRDDRDLMANCERFANTEKCVRAFAKDCLSGLHKAAVGSIASATKRYRTQECKTAENRAKYKEPLICSNRKGTEMLMVQRNITGMAQAIRDMKISPEEKMIKVCCLLSVLDKEIETRFNRDCPKATPIILAIVHAMTDDARSTLCRNPRCGNALNGLANVKYTPPQNLLEPVMQILFTISTE